MVVELRFDYHSCSVYIPDGYISDLKEFKLSFIDWLQEQPECMVSLGYSFGEDDFLKYLNNVILENSREKAYFVPNGSNGKKKNVIEL